MKFGRAPTTMQTRGMRAMLPGGMAGTALDRLWRRHWATAVALAVAGYALAWSWSGRLQAVGNAVFWLSAAVVGLGLVLRAWDSPLARRWLLAAAASGGALAVTTLWSVAPADTLKDAVTFGAVLAVAAAAGAEIEEEGAARDRLARALGWLAPGALVLTAVVVLAGFADDSVPGPGASGFFNGPNVLSIFLALTLPFALVHPRVAGRPPVLLALVAAAALAASLSAGRTGFGALVLAVSALALGRRRWTALATALALCALAAGIAASTSWTPPTLGERIEPEAEHTERVTGQRRAPQSAFSELVGARSEAWAESVRLLDERPLQGHGFGTGDTLFDRYGSRARFTWFVGAFASGTNPHNAYLQAPLELGLVGGLLFLVPVLGALALAVRFLATGDADPSTLAFCAAVVAAAAAAFLESTLAHFGSLTLLSWIAVAAMWAVWLRQRRSLHSAA
jgi:O-antigen ligase